MKSDGKLHEWVVADSDEGGVGSGAEPCALWCRAEGTDLVKRLAPKVLDGTRCRQGDEDMCINGRCQVGGTGQL